MIGEGIRHNHPVTNYFLTDVLNEWLNKITSDENLNPNLTLILENDSTTVNLIKEYSTTGQISPLLEYVSPLFPMELLEMYFEFKRFYQKIDAVNLKRNKKINFKLKGFEEIGYNIKEEYFKQNKAENELWFINERDKYTSDGIIKYLNENPEQKALIFYGNAHIVPGYSNKKLPGFSIADSLAMGYWLAQYLINEFGQDNIELINTIGLPAKYLDNTPFEALRDKSFLLKKPDDKLKWLFRNNSEKILVTPYKNIPSPELNLTLSRYIIEKSIERAEKFEKLLPGYKAGWGMIPLYYLSVLLGKRFVKSGDLKGWYNNDFDCIAFLDTKDFYNNIFSYYLKNFNNADGKTILSQMIYWPAIISYTSGSENRWKDSVWGDFLKSYKFMNAVGILWAGFPDEKIKAKEYLKNFSGQDFDDAAEYFIWFRRKYLNYGI